MMGTSKFNIFELIPSFVECLMLLLIEFGKIIFHCSYPMMGIVCIDEHFLHFGQ